jgi:hypothetical protein
MSFKKLIILPVPTEILPRAGLIGQEITARISIISNQVNTPDIPADYDKYKEKRGEMTFFILLGIKFVI